MSLLRHPWMPACAGMTGLLLAAPAHALEFKLTLEGEARAFYQAPDRPVPASGSAKLELFHGWDDTHQRIVGEFFGRNDDGDEARTHDDVRELYYQVIGDDFEFRFGARRVYWGVTESRHLVDIVNQTDLVEDIDGKTKLGAPMMNLALIREVGTFDILLLPYERARTFPGPHGHPQFPFPVNANEALYESRREQRHLDYALRYAASLGSLDLGLAWFDGTAREPHLLPCVRRGASGATLSNPGAPNCDFPYTASFVQPPPTVPPQTPDQIAAQFAADVQANLVLVPYYDRLRQVSLDAQYVMGSLALKLEALHRLRQGRGSWAAVSGFEYSFGDVPALAADVSLLGEYLYDEDSEGLNVLFDDELFAGTRWAFNDVAGTAVLAGVIGKRSNWKNRVASIEASRRLTDDWKLSLEARLFALMPKDSPAGFLQDQDSVTLSLERFF